MAVVSKGFTLLELLVTISIIGILLGIGSVSFSTAQKRGRDSRRQADMKAVQKAMEECYAIDNEYPDITWGEVLTCVDGTTVTMQEIPVDPKDGSDYLAVSMTSDAYQFCIDLESDGEWETDNPNQDFCVYSQQ
ncbi:MAG: prepilin-type N-terminal cleavage/methylation domain-containing protein [Candidatus Beckwithbacteria bacterium]